MLTRWSPGRVPVVTALAVVGLSAAAGQAQDMFRTSEAITGTIVTDGVLYDYLAVYVQESGDSDGDGVPDYEGDSTFNGAILVKAHDSPIPLYLPPPIGWFPEVLDHLRTAAHDPWPPFFPTIGDGFHSDTLFASGLHQAIDFSVNDQGPLTWSLQSLVAGECTVRSGITLPIEKEAGYYFGANGTGLGVFEMRATQGGSPLSVTGTVTLTTHTAAPPTFDYLASSLVRLDSYNEGTGEFSGTCTVTFTMLPACSRVDLNGDGLVDFSDYLEFLNRYDAGDPSVDYNGDGLVDFSDYLEFLNLYDTCG